MNQVTFTAEFALTGGLSMARLDRRHSPRRAPESSPFDHAREQVLGFPARQVGI
jgi:hypothetical protein